MSQFAVHPKYSKTSFEALIKKNLNEIMNRKEWQLRIYSRELHIIFSLSSSFDTIGTYSGYNMTSALTDSEVLFNPMIIIYWNVVVLPLSMCQFLLIVAFGKKCFPRITHPLTWSSCFGWFLILYFTYAKHTNWLTCNKLSRVAVFH